MKTEGFRVQDVVYLVSDKAWHDLHNDFLFSTLAFNAENASVVMCWSSADILLNLCFQNVFLLKIKEGDALRDRTGATTTSFVGFLHSEDATVMDGFLPDADVPDAHFIVSFEDGSAIKVGCSNATLEIKPRF